MKKFIIIQIVLIVAFVTAIKISLSCMPNNEILHKGKVDDFRDKKAWIIDCDYQAEPYLHTIEDHINSMDYFNKRNFNTIVMIAEATGKFDSYNRKSVDYIIVENIIKGDQNITGTELSLDGGDCFIYDDQETYTQRINMFGLPSTQEVEYYRNKNLLKEGHKYLIIAYEKSIPDVAEPYYFLGGYYDLADTVSLPCNTGKTYLCDYWDNEIFSAYQEEIDSYYQLKEDIFNYYELDNYIN